MPNRESSNCCSSRPKLEDTTAGQSYRDVNRRTPVLDFIVMDGSATLKEFRRFVDRHRVQCLWFLRVDYHPETVADQLAVLRLIEQHGDRRAFQEAAHFRQWLSPHSSGKSAGV